MGPQERLAKLRRLMREHHIDAWLVPSTDPHQSEYVADCWKARAWLSGFTGSAGTVVVTQEKAGLWTDPRYHIRAAKESEGSGIDLFRMDLAGVPSYVEWLGQELPERATIGFDGSVVSVAEVARLNKAVKGKSITLSYQNDLVGQLWQDRPEIPKTPIFLHDVAFAGESRESKFQRIRDKLRERGVQADLLTSLDDIAWTLNIRGRDVEFNPVTISYAVISEREVRLFVHHAKVPIQVREMLENDGVVFSEYEDVFPYLQQLPQGTTVLFDPEKTSYKLEQTASHISWIREGASIPQIMKATKNETELQGIRKAHIRDGVAMVRWMYWLDQQIPQVAHTEITVADNLAEFRSLGEYYQGLSFGTSAGYQANAAIGHYHPQPETTATIRPEGILLIDSGGQYLDGTTDITRTVSLGSPAPEQKRAFTVVLKGHIRLARARFPKGTTGSQLDVLAREPLWEQGFTCRHGIGHGVGLFLNVHEGPQRFSKKNTVPFEPGMVTTNEPGVYFQGRFGIRIESILITIPVETTEFGEFYGFETVTLCPIDLDLVEVSLLSSEEIAWLNDYHQTVFGTLAPFLSQNEREWLHRETRTI